MTRSTPNIRIDRSIQKGRPAINDPLLGTVKENLKLRHGDMQSRLGLTNNEYSRLYKAIESEMEVRGIDQQKFHADRNKNVLITILQGEDIWRAASLRHRPNPTRLELEVLVTMAYRISRNCRRRTVSSLGRGMLRGTRVGNSRTRY
jgi:hypothetical protein